VYGIYVGVLLNLNLKRTCQAENRLRKHRQIEVENRIAQIGWPLYDHIMALWEIIYKPRGDWVFCLPAADNNEIEIGL